MRSGRTRLWCWAWVSALGLDSAVARAADSPGPVDFNRQIRPILAERCYQCHGPDAKQRKADLRLDLREGLFRTADGTTIVAPSQPEESELLFRISTELSELRMPPA